MSGHLLLAAGVAKGFALLREVGVLPGTGNGFPVLYSTTLFFSLEYHYELMVFNISNTLFILVAFYWFFKMSHL